MPPKKVKTSNAKQKQNAKRSHQAFTSKDMLGYLKYAVTAKKNTDEEKAAAHKAMSIYNSLSTKCKSDFVQRFHRQRFQENPKDLGWTKEFETTFEKNELPTNEKHIGLYTRHLASPICGYPHF